MAVDISAEVTRTFPTTEATLSSDADVDYSAQKDRAISRAKRKLYGSRTVPTEASIPEVAAYWIADQAVVFLIPLAIDFYMSKRRVSENKEGMNITHHNHVNALQDLRTELEASLASSKQDALEAIDSKVSGDAIPATSFNGMAIDPLVRAMERGPVL
jgi:hypothetical protein